MSRRHPGNVPFAANSGALRWNFVARVAPTGGIAWTIPISMVYVEPAKKLPKQRKRKKSSSDRIKAMRNGAATPSARKAKVVEKARRRKGRLQFPRLRHSSSPILRLLQPWPHRPLLLPTPIRIRCPLLGAILLLRVPAKTTKSLWLLFDLHSQTKLHCRLL